MPQPINNTPPREDEIEINLFGPGYGESIVVHLGFGDWLVVDSCLESDKRSAALKYFERIGVSAQNQIKLIVATHWHDDHIRGLSSLYSSATAANFVVSAAMNEAAFRELIAVMRERAFMDTTGVEEWTQLLKLMEARKKSDPANYRPCQFASANKRLFQRTAGPLPSAVWSLSPSETSIAQAMGMFQELLPKQNASKNRVISPKPNHTSVVLWIECGPSRILLGADLEEIGEKHTGWSVIVESAERPHGKATVFKVPHHGSQNGHHPGVWTDMLVSPPLAILTPYSRGRNPPPLPADIVRLKGLTNRGYITNKPGAPKDKRKNAGPIERTIAEAVRSIRDVPYSTGQVRLRSTNGSDWTVELLGTALDIGRL